MEDTEFLDPFERMIQVVTPAMIRAIESDRQLGDLWQTIDESGFLDALVPEDAGGFGLALDAVRPLIEVAGRFAAPVPIGQTMAARALIASAGILIPQGPIVLARGREGAADDVALALVSEHALVSVNDSLQLIALNEASLRDTGVYRSLSADIRWERSDIMDMIEIQDVHRFEGLAATLIAVEIAGLALRVLELTVAYANDRCQFGKPIGKQQAIQQQLAVMAENVMMTQMASQLACCGQLMPDIGVAAMAKSVASAAAVDIANVAHAVHGAIGISQEYDLQIYTRGLHQRRATFGSEGYWTRLLGQARVSSELGDSIDFVRAHMDTNSKLGME